MPIKTVKTFFLSLFATLVFCIGFSGVHADEYAQHDVTLLPSGDELVSEIMYEEEAFNSVGVQLKKEIEGLMVNFGYGWEEIHVHDDGYGPEALIFTRPVHTIRFKTPKESEESLVLKIHLFYYQEEADEMTDAGNLQSSTSNLVAKKFEIISRKEWGADETLRYWDPEWSEGSSTSGESVDVCGDVTLSDDESNNILRVTDKSPAGDLLVWPIQTTKKVYKIVLHHTASEIRDINGDNRMDSRDYKAILRAIYQYHAVTRGWGDIGYNYIIDPLGNVYEGRYGGDKVVGAHARCYNNGSMGISIIGNYENTSIPEPALQSLISLVAQKSALLGIDPEGVSTFRGKKLPNIIGHRDIGATSCPGGEFYDTLPLIRQRAALILRSGSFKEGGLDAGNLDYNAEFSSDLSEFSLNPTERKEITLKFKNIGKKSWDQNTWLHVALNNDANARVIPVIEDKTFVAADMVESSVAPGKTGTFKVEVEAGYKSGDYYFEVAPVVNGRYKISRSSVYLHLDVGNPDFSYEVVSQSFPKGNIFQGQKIEATLDLKNTGNVTWKNYGANQITLGTSSPRDRKSIFIKENPSRIGYLLDSEVPPGKTGRFVMALDVPTDKTGMVIEQFTPVIEGISWLKDNALGFKATIKVPRHIAQVIEVSSVSEMMPGEMARFELKMKNKGDLAWDSESMQTTLLGRGVKVFKNKLVPTETINPGETGTFSFWVQAPYTEGQHSVYLRSKFYKTVIQGGAARYVINVPKVSLRAQPVSQSDKNTNLNPGQEKTLTVQFKNLGNTVWRNSGQNAVYLGTAQPQDRESRLYYKEGWQSKFRAAALQEDEVKPGETGTFKFKIKPGSKGVYNEYFQLVTEGVGWIDGSLVKWSFRVFGDTVNSPKTSTSSTGSDTSDTDLNKARASVITKSKTTTTTKTSTTTASSTTKTTTNTPSSTTVKTTPSLPSTPSSTPFRVKLSYADDSASLTANTPFKVTNEKEEALFSLNAGETVLVRRINDNIHAQVGSTSKSAGYIRFVPATGGVMEIVTMERRPTWNPTLNDNRFRGTVEVRTVNGKATYINELPLEDYLKGLAEVSNDAPYEKQKVIAVLARSYARFYMEDENRKFPGLPYDGSDDPDIFQRYLGYGFEMRSPSFLKAVAETKDVVVTYNGELVKTPYFNQSDGKTYSAKEVWGWTNTPYLQSVDDPWCKGLTKSGHGVGLSGYGATKQAEEGKSYIEIIKYYYSGVEVERQTF